MLLAVTCSLSFSYLCISVFLRASCFVKCVFPFICFFAFFFFWWRACFSSWRVFVCVCVCVCSCPFCCNGFLEWLGFWVWYQNCCCKGKDGSGIFGVLATLGWMRLFREHVVDETHKKWFCVWEISSREEGYLFRTSFIQFLEFLNKTRTRVFLLHQTAFATLLQVSVHFSLPLCCCHSCNWKRVGKHQGAGGHVSRGLGIGRWA